MCDFVIVGRWQWRPLSTSHFSFSQTFTKPQNAAWHCWCPSQTLCALLPGASPVAVSLPAVGPLALPHPTHRAGGAGLLSWASRAVAAGCRRMKPSFSAARPSWQILRHSSHPRAPCRVRPKALFPGPCPKCHPFCLLVACSPQSFSKSSSLINQFHMNSHLRVCF